MEKFSVEIDNWGSYELVKDFSSFDLAKRHGISNFPQNEWRIFNRTAGRVVYNHNPLSEISESVNQELQRFSNTEVWRQRFIDRAEQAAREVEARQQRGRLTEIASRQREEIAARQQRLSGFQFVGDEPEILRQQPPTAHAAVEDDWEDWDEDEYDDRLDLAKEKVNWIMEGF